MMGFAVLLVALVVVGVVVMLALRSWTLEEVRTEAWLREPETHTLSYVVPDGQDPAILVAALAGAGFTARAEMRGGVERLVVACDEDQRDRVRSVIEAVHLTGFEGVEMHVAHASFEDER